MHRFSCKAARGGAGRGGAGRCLVSEVEHRERVEGEGNGLRGDARAGRATRGRPAPWKEAAGGIDVRLEREGKVRGERGVAHARGGRGV